MLILSLLAVVLFHTPASAQWISLGETTSTHRTVLSVLVREKCDKDWLSLVLKDSQIRPADRNRVSVGTLIRLRRSARSCHLPAPMEVARASAPLLENAAYARNRVRAQRDPKRSGARVAQVVTKAGLPQPSSEKASLEELQSQVARYKAEGALLASRIGELTREREQMKRERDQAQSWKDRSGIWLFLAFLLGSIVAWIVQSAARARSQARLICYQKELAYNHEGQAFLFKFIGARVLVFDGDVVPLYRCQGRQCSSTEIPGRTENLRHHAEYCPDGKVSLTVDSHPKQSE